MEQDWIDFKQHWNESLRDMYHENKRLKVKAAEAGDKSAKEMAEEYMNTEQHTINLSKMKDEGKKRELEGMVDNIWKLKFCSKKGAECYFREFDALWEETHTTCDYDIPIEICMQKATCAILIAELPWNVTNKANLEWWNGMGFIEREDVWDAFKCDNDDDSDIDKDEKVNDGRDEIKVPHRWNKACKRCADKRQNESVFTVRAHAQTVTFHQQRGVRYPIGKDGGKENPIEINLEDETPEQSLERIDASHNTTVQQLVKEKKILKDDNPETLPRIKIERNRRNAGNYKEEDTVKVKDGEESQEERNEHTEEKDTESEQGADPIAVTTNQALQKGDAENVEEKATKGTDASEKNEREKTENMERLFTNVAIVVVKMNGEREGTKMK
eukprot:jgi/Psemu1/30343/gm1.30343_g